jgi:TatD family-associated radical SAM protein
MEEIYKAIDEFDFDGCKEAVFCGYGEPTMVLDKLIAVSKYMREKYPMKLRLNTNGLGDLIHKRSIAKELCEAVDCISISLNMPDAKSYNEVVRPAYGEKSFDAMLKFAVDCKKYLDDVRFTVVDCIGEENVKASQKVADSLGISLRVREYSE